MTFAPKQNCTAGSSVESIDCIRSIEELHCK